MEVPEEIAWPEKRLAGLKQAQAVIEERHGPHTAEKQREYEAKLANRAERRARGQGGNGLDPEPPSTTPEAREQYNFRDPVSRIMKARNGTHFEQSYNAQTAVETEEGMLVLLSLPLQRGGRDQCREEMMEA
jgi:hypothetical protein